MSRKVECARVVYSLLLAVIVLTPRISAAQSTTLDVFTPAQTARDGFATSSAEDQGHLRFGAQLYIEYGNDPLVYETTGTPSQRVQIVDHQVVGHLGLSLGLADRVVLFAGVPMSIRMSGDPSIHPDVPNADGSHLGDVYGGARLRLFGSRESVFVLALQATVTAPLSEMIDDDQSYSGDESVTVHPQVLAQINAGRLRLLVNVGARFRENQTFLNVEVGDQLTYALGVLVEAAKGLDVLAEIHGATVLQQFFHRDEAPLEVLVGLKYRHTSGLVVGVGGGPGLVRGFGSPDFRVLATLGYTMPERDEAAPRVSGDSDGDGIDDARDECVDEAEDVDGFEDENGCPELDNDGDGVPDETDECPTDAEDVDGFEDGNGCPDPDDDHDGTPDVHDECRTEPEDMDGFEDGNGCPEPDNDGDGVLDAQDRCPVVAGVARNEGCPESDRDSDGVPDHTDNCPDEAGTAANQGCREQQLVQISGEQISLVENVYFRTQSNTIDRRSFPLLDNVARVISSHPEIVRVRVEGHTDSRGGRARNVRLSLARAQAVVRYLTSRGVAADRLEAIGHGPDRPLVPNEQTEEDHARNRRVEFHIEGAPEAAPAQAPAPAP